MEKTKKLFVIWGILVVVIVGLLTTLGFMLKKTNSEYKEVEDALLKSAKNYVDVKGLYPKTPGETLKVTSEMLNDAGMLDNLGTSEDKCVGYVIVKYKNVYKYEAYIKCNNYTTKGY